MQAVLAIADLPKSPIESAAVFFERHLKEAKTLLSDEDVTAIAIVFPKAGPDHDDWRRTLARDLARAATPKRANVIGAEPGSACTAMIGYLANAKGVTGQYCPTHD